MKKIITILTLFCSLQAFAKTEGHIITGGTNAGIFAYTPTAYSDYEVYLSANGGYGYFMKNGFQFSLTSVLTLQSGTDILSLAMGPTYNFDAKKVEESYFVSALLGATFFNYKSGSDTTPLIILEGGKRFLMTENVSYVPSVAMSKELDSNSADPTFSFNLVRFSFFF
jgi:hypothetical protein